MKELVKAHIAKALNIGADFDISVPEIKEFGHYSTNLAMRQAKERKMAPLKLAQEFTEQLKAEKIFSRVEAVAPGFINLWLSDAFLTEQFDKVITGKPQVD